MTVTIDLDDDIYELASVYASARGIDLGAALGELIRANEPSSKVMAGPETNLVAPS